MIVIRDDDDINIHKKVVNDYLDFIDDVDTKCH